MGRSDLQRAIVITESTRPRIPGHDRPDLAIQRSAKQQELVVVRECGDRVVQRLAIRRDLRRITAAPSAAICSARAATCRFTCPPSHSCFGGQVARGRELLRGRDRLPGLRGPVQLDVGVAQSDVSESELRIEAQCLVKRSCRFDPHVVVKVGEALIVEALRFGVLRARVVMDRADTGPKRYRPLEELLGDRRDRMQRVLGGCGGRKNQYKVNGKPKMVALDFPFFTS